MFGAEELEWCGYPVVKKNYRIHERDRETDRRTDRKRATAYGHAYQDGFIHIAANGWISVNTEEKKNKHYIQKVKNQ